MDLTQHPLPQEDPSSLAPPMVTAVLCAGEEDAGAARLEGGKGSPMMPVQSQKPQALREGLSWLPWSLPACQFWGNPSQRRVWASTSKAPTVKTC